MTNQELLSIKNLSVVYNTTRGRLIAIDNFSLGLSKGEIISVVGESGSGKSTLGYAILRILPPNGKIVNGEIHFNGINIIQLSEKELRELRGKKISMIFQDPMTSLDPLMRIGDQIVETILEHEKMDKEEAWNIGANLLESLGIDSERMYDFPHQLSGGMRQRIVIALAIVLNPKVVIADEPTTGLDVIVQYQILDLLKRLRDERKISIIFITHDLGLAYDISDRIAVMYAGKLVELAEKNKLFDRPLHPYTQGLLKSIPELSIDSKNLVSIPGYPPDMVTPPRGCRFHPRCPIAMSLCRQKEPKLIEVEKNHYVRCFRSGEVAFK